MKNKLEKKVGSAAMVGSMKRNRNRELQSPVLTFLFIASCILLGLPAGAPAFGLSGELKQGPHGVGFKVIHTFDYSRAYKGKQGRPMQVAVWYPTAVTAPKMKFVDYLPLYLTEENVAKPTEKQKRDNVLVWEKELAARLSPSPNIKELLQANTNVVKDAGFAKGRFPVIIYGAGSQGEAFENSVLCEYLASYGYVVLASPAVGQFDHQTTLDAVGLEAEARDMEFLIAQAQNLPSADLNNLGVMGWSWGGMSAMLVQLRNPNVDAVVSLDGAIAMHEEKLKQTAFSNINNIRVPVMYMSAGNTTPRVRSFISRVNYSNSLLLDIKEVSHADFSSYNFLARNFAPSLSEAEKSKQRAYEVACQYVLRFFDYTIKGDKSAKDFLEKEPADRDLFAMTSKKSLPLPPSQEEFFTTIREKGFETAYKIYKEVISRDAEYQTFEAWEMTALADQLFKSGRAEDAIKCAKLRLEAYPDDYLSNEWLANLYYKQKDWSNALKYYEIAYEMAQKLKNTPELSEELEWYRKRIETVKKNLSQGT